jgi:hypothetical protein
LPLPRREPGLRYGRQDAEQKTGINGKLATATEFTGKEQRLVVGALSKTAGMERDRDQQVGIPLRNRALPGSTEETGQGTIESKAAVEFETVDGVT